MAPAGAVAVEEMQVVIRRPKCPAGNRGVRKPTSTSGRIAESGFGLPFGRFRQRRVGRCCSMTVRVCSSANCPVIRIA